MKCRHCGEPIYELNYGTGSVWVHRDPYHFYPYQICRPAPVAEPEDPPKTIGQWWDELSKPVTKPLEYKEIP